MENRTVTRRGLLRAGASVSILGVSGCVGGLDLTDAGGVPTEGPAADTADGGSTSQSETSTASPTPELSVGQHSHVESFEEQDLSGWEGEVDALTITEEATRGSYAVSLAPGHSRVRLPIQPTTSQRYSLWWNVSRNSNLLVLFEDDAGNVGFSFEVQPGQGEGVVLNSDREIVGKQMYGSPGSNAWYRIAFSNVDFREREFNASLHDVGDVELISANRQFHESIDSVSRITIRNNVPGNGNPVMLDQIEVGQG
jgi:hypothetical protein